MTSRLEFVDDAGAPLPAGHPDDVLDVGRHTRLTGPRRLATLIAAAAVLVAGCVSVQPRDTVVQGAGSGSAAPVEVAPTGPPAVSAVRGLAGTSGRLTDYVRPTSAAGGCPAVPVGSSPTRVIARQVRAALPDFTVTDVASTLDEFTALCSVRLRARDAHGVVVALIVSAPASATGRQEPFVALQFGIDTAADGTTTIWVAATTGRHWSVVVGAVGALDALPSSTALQRLAQRDELTW